jgi:UrcA family protein
MIHNLARAAVVAAFIAGTLLAPLPATAAGADATVSYADLNLASSAGKAALDRRVARAADRVCGVGDERFLRLQAIARRCAAEARDKARPAIETAYRAATDRQLAARDMSVTVTP